MIEFISTQPVAINYVESEEIISQIRNDAMGGWLELPKNYDHDGVAQIKAIASKIQLNSKYLVCIGIGGSYLGHRALIEALNPQSPTQVLYAGYSFSAKEYQKLFQTLANQDFSVLVISKSGTTAEPAIGFRLLREKLEQKYGHAGANERIYVTTDAKTGALRAEANQEKWAQFAVPDTIGGRYSVLSAVGLLPLAVAGVNIDELLAGAATEYDDNFTHGIADSMAIKYANARTALQKENYDVEVLATFEPEMRMFTEWWKQLFGESEGKNHQGIFPASTVYTTDLHSLGQYMQDGRRNIFETIMGFEADSTADLEVPSSAQNFDGLGFVDGKKLSHLNEMARLATVTAHRQGEIPVFEIKSPAVSATSLGALVYFFELACAVSAKLAKVNPFDQPGVESYKEIMMQLFRA